MFEPITFTQFVAMATLSPTELQNWINSQKTIQFNNSPLDRSYHTDHNDHSNTTRHSETSHSETYPHSNAPHSDGTGNYNQREHSDLPHGQSYHSNIAGTQHVQRPSHQDYPIHRDNNLAGGGHSNSVTGHENKPAHNETTGHTNYNAHYNQHQNTPHTDNTPHANSPHSDTNPFKQTPHSDTNRHSDRTPHNDLGFNHSNYVPAAPAILNIAKNEQVRDVFDVGIYAYDKNIDGHGSQDTKSRTVKYAFKLRQLKDRNGNNKISSWVNYLNGDTVNSFSFNSIDPLKTGNKNPFATEGVYELECYAYNDAISLNGVTKTYVGAKTNIVFKIVQNIDPVVEIVNGAEFINHNFGTEGARGPSGYKKYDDMFKNAPSNRKHGIFVEMKISDDDLTDGHKAFVYLEDSKGNNITGSKIPATITGNNPDKKAIAFIPKSTYLDEKHVLGATLVVEVLDYKNNNFSDPAGAHIVQKRTTLTGTLMRLNTDSSYPVTKYSASSSFWTQSANVSIDISDAGVGLHSGHYQIVKKGLSYNDSNWTSINVGNSSFSVNIKNEGEWQVWVKLIDRAGNTSIIQSGVYKVAPIQMSLETNPKYPSSIPITENLYSLVNTDCMVEITKVEAYIVGKEAESKTILTTSSSGRLKTWEGHILVPKMTIDGDYDLNARVYRSDGSSEQISVPIRVFTSINAAFKYKPIFEVEKKPDVAITTSKYVDKVMVTLFKGTSYEKTVAAKVAESTATEKTWGIDWVTPANIPVANYTIEAIASLPWGKTQKITETLVYMGVDYDLRHTDEWEDKRKKYNIYHSGNQELPRLRNVFFNGEKFVFDIEVRTGDSSIFPTNVQVKLLETGNTLQLTKDASGYLWDGEMYDPNFRYLWATRGVYPLNFEVFIELNIGIAKTYMLQGVVDSTDDYWRGHTLD